MSKYVKYVPFHSNDEATKVKWDLKSTEPEKGIIKGRKKPPLVKKKKTD